MNVRAVTYPMLETNDLVLIGVLCCGFSALFSLVMALILHYFRNRVVDSRLGDCENRINSLDMAMRGATGRSNRAEKSERMQTAMVEVAAILKNPEVADKQKAIMELALKYPDIAMDLIKKGI